MAHSRKNKLICCVVGVMSFIPAALAVAAPSSMPTVFRPFLFGFPESIRFHCELNFSSNACGDGSENRGPYNSFCYGEKTCRPLSLSSCDVCGDNTDGSFHVYHKDFDSDARTSPFRWRVAYPPDCMDCPIMIFVPTRAGKVPLEEYNQFVEQLVSFGMVVVIMTSKTSIFQDIFYPSLVLKMDAMYEFVLGSGLADLMTPVGSSPRTDKIVYGGHGQGARIMIQRFIEKSCTGNIFGSEECACENGLVGGVVMLSPTEDLSTQADVGNGLVIQDNVDIAWTTPALLINGVFDAVKGTGFCSPQDISDDHFFMNWDGPIWKIKFDRFGHHDISTHDESGVLCKRTDVQNDVDKLSSIEPLELTRAQYKNLYRRSVAGSVFAFVDGLINGNSRSFLAIQTILTDNDGYGMFDRQDLQILASKRNVPEDVETVGVVAQCTYRGKLFSDEVQALLYATYALGGLAIVLGIPYLYNKWIIKPIRKMKEEMPEGIRNELREEGLIKSGATKNPTYNDGLQKLKTPMAPPPGMDDGLSVISTEVGTTVGLEDGEESIVPYSSNGNSVRISAQTRTEDDDIF